MQEAPLVEMTEAPTGDHLQISDEAGRKHPSRVRKVPERNAEAIEALMAKKGKRKKIATEEGVAAVGVEGMPLASVAVAASAAAAVATVVSPPSTNWRERETKKAIAEKKRLEELDKKRQELAEKKRQEENKIPPSVRMLLSGAKLQIKEEGMLVIGDKGYRTALASHGVKTGSWYYELQLNNAQGAVRVGWGTEQTNLECPIGFDRYGYSMRSTDGCKFHQRAGEKYGSGFGKGDVIGCLINLSEGTVSARDDILPQNRVLLGSSLVFFKNGECFGTAFKDLFNGCYFPAVALYMFASVSLQFGPTFQFPISQEQYPHKPMCECWALQNLSKRPAIKL